MNRLGMMLIGCALMSTAACSASSSERSDLPKPNDPATHEPGVDTIPPSPPPPGNVTGNAAPIHNDESVSRKDPGRAQGAGSTTGSATATTH